MRTVALVKILDETRAVVLLANNSKYSRRLDSIGPMHIAEWLHLDTL